MKTPPAQLHAGIHTPRPIACWDTQGNVFTCVCLSTSEGPQLLLRTVKISDSRNTKELLWIALGSSSTKNKESPSLCHCAVKFGENGLTQKQEWIQDSLYQTTLPNLPKTHKIEKFLARKSGASFQLGWYLQNFYIRSIKSNDIFEVQTSIKCYIILMCNIA